VSIRCGATFMPRAPHGQSVDRSLQTDARAKPVHPEVGIASDASRSHSFTRASEETSGGAAAADRAFHRRRPAGGGPRARADDVCAVRLRTGALRVASGADRDRRVRLAADPRPEELGLAEPLG